MLNGTLIIDDAVHFPEGTEAADIMQAVVLKRAHPLVRDTMANLKTWIYFKTH